MVQKRERRRRDGSTYAVWRVRWYDETSTERSKTFDRAADARAFEAKIRALKRSGYRRTKEAIVVEHGKLQVRPVRRGGLIRDSKDVLVGSRWPGIVGAATGLEPLAPFIIAAAIAQVEKRSLVA